MWVGSMCEVCARANWQMVALHMLVDTRTGSAKLDNWHTHTRTAHRQVQGLLFDL